MKQVETLRELQLVEVEILKDFAKFCRENGIHYALDAGTLIGAVRHKGFIPWDDDIDVCLSRLDYNKLVERCAETHGMISDRCRLINPEYEESYNGYIPLIALEHSKLNSKQFRRAEDLKIAISLFIYDGVPAGKLQRWVYFKHMYVLRALHALCRADFDHINTKWAKKYGKVLSPFFSEKMLKAYRAKILNYQKKYPYEKSRYISANTDISPFKLVEEKQAFEAQTTVEFENETYTTYSDYDRHLRSYYGDYMTPPDEAERTAHHSFEAWYQKEGSLEALS